MEQCYFCGHACGYFICDECDEATLFGPHVPEDHKEFNFEEESDEHD